MSKTNRKGDTMSTTDKAQQIVINIKALADQGHSIDDAVSIIAKASHCDTDTIIQAIGFALYA
jgi:hypothetical protein